MKRKIIHIECPAYILSKKLDYIKAGNEIDSALNENFMNQYVMIRAIQSSKHKMPRDKLIERIIEYGNDRYDSNSEYAANVTDRPIDLFGLVCKIEGQPIAKELLEGFHKWKPKCEEKPQHKADIWMILDPKQFEQVEYNHSRFNIKVSDAYVYKNPNNKPDALIGIVIVD